MKAFMRRMLDDPLLTQAEVSEVLGISAKTVQRWRKEGKLMFSRLGHRTVRIHQSEVLKLLREDQAA